MSSNAALDRGNKRPENRRVGAGGGRGAGGSRSISKNNKNVPKQSDILVELAREKFPLIFRNQLKDYCAVVEELSIPSEYIEKEKAYQIQLIK